MADTTQQTDVVVIGAGIAGLTAALELLNNGRQVTLLDRCHRDEVGGLAREAFGGMFMVDSPQQRRSGIEDSYDLALDDWLRIADFEEQDVWPKRWAEQYVARARDDVGKWLTEQGVWFFPVVNWAERGMYSDGNSVPRFHLTWGCGQGLVDAVWDKLQNHDDKDDLVVHFETNVTELLEDEDGAIHGVLLEDGTEIRSNAVVIAAGGIGGNLDLVKKEWPKDMGDPPEQLLMGSHYYADGSMHEEVKKHGGNVTHIDRMWNYADAVRHPKPRRPLHGVKLIPPRSGLMLDPDGKRYGPVPVMPTFDARYALERMCEDPRKYSWLVCNRKIATRELDVSGSEHNPHIREKRLGRFLLSVLTGKPHLVDYFLRYCPDFVAADTLDELATKMNRVAGNDDLDADLMKTEIKRYDDMLARGKSLWNDDQIRRIAQYRNWRGDRLRTSKFQQIDDPKAGPLIAIRLQPMARKSLGGIQTDLDSRVLHAETGEPIPNLYAAGEAAGFGGGGMHGRRSLEGTFLGGCVFSARIAAQAIARGDMVTHSTNGDVPAGAVEAE